MNAIKRPVTVLIVSCLYIGVGVVGFAYHFPELVAPARDSVWIELTELLAIVCGTFMLAGRNWARWLALVWMAFHVVISFPVLGQAAVHFLFLVVIGWILLRSDATQYFGRARGVR